MRSVSPTIVGLTLGVVLASCGPPAKPVVPAVSLTTEVQDDMARQGAFAWASNRPLRWDDFQGTPPRTGEAGALTSYSIFYGVRCTGTVFEFLTVAGFLPKSSWVKPFVLNGPRAESDRALRHEQTHFDISEVYTRRIRKSFIDLYEPCRRAETLDPLAQQMLRQEKAAQDQYDNETRHGLATTQQKAWEQRVAADLQSLAKYER